MPDNRNPLIYGAFPVCRNYTVRAQLRHDRATMRRGRKNSLHHARSQQRRLYAERLHALDQPDAAGSSADRRQRHAQDAGALKNAKNNARLQSKKQSGVGISNKKILRYRQKINVFKARTRCGKLKRKYTIR